MSLVFNWIEIKSFKHDGTSHRFWDRGFVLHEDNNYIIVASKQTKVVETNGRSWFTKEPAISIFSKKDWFNVIAMIKNDGISYYCNIASPCLVEKKTIKYIDYDLDIKYNEKKQLKLLDRNEYELHRKQYNYSDDLNLVLWNQILEISVMIQKNKFPFNDKQICDYYEMFKKKVMVKKDEQNSDSNSK